MEIADLTPAERRVRLAFPRGEGVDFRQDPEGGDRTIRAEVLRALLLGVAPADGEIAGLKVWGARITGELDLMYATVEHPVRLRECHFEQAPNLYGAQLRQVVLQDSELPGLNAGSARFEGVLRLTCSRITGPVRLAGSRIAGAFFANGTELGDPALAGDGAGDGGADGSAHGEPVLQLNHADIGTDVWAPDLVAHGQVRMNGATVAGEVNLDHARLSLPGGTALHAETLTVGTDLRAYRLCARGRVNLRGARIGGQLNLSRATLSNPGGDALRASSCVAGELWLREAEPVEGAVNLRRAQFDVLHVPPGAWPRTVKLDGLTYRSLVPHLPAAERLPVLGRDDAGYVPHSYEQLAGAYRAIGDEAAARTVQLEKLRRHRGTLPWYARAWGYLQDAAVGYGFRPMRATGWLSALLLTGTVAFALERPQPLKAGEAPDFNPVFYTLDLLLPIIDFGQERAFAPEGAQQWLSYLLVVMGWILATTVVAGISRSLSRQ
ncbi:membrane-associated oxidoreductase [Streptomyces sp. GC420]|uniref:membrane-associated oxidoreductase n=1 Tax=Streptomyces sp. GC420 TaxID=2697568 RepID=UPI001414F253|nr:membrane-associated oxidoreductase [Streptomyces sp. GC420]NBM16237.1 membrane-associated oxidoreductase [Streptomyces sp. GC420]